MRNLIFLTAPIISALSLDYILQFDSQRVCVTFTVLFSFLAANAVFFGRAKVSAEQDLSIAIYSSLFVVPVGVIFPLLFMVRAHLLGVCVFHV